MRLSGLEEQDGDLAEVEVDEVLGFVGDVRAEVAPDNHVPGWVVLFVEFLLDVRGNVLFDVELRWKEDDVKMVRKTSLYPPLRSPLRPRPRPMSNQRWPAKFPL